MSKHRITESFLADLRARTPLPALIGRRVQLRRSGRTYTGLCPFHGERRPSFAVYQNGFHCFGCGAQGDAIAWLMEMGRMPFLDAVAVLADEAGLDMPVQHRVTEEMRARVRERSTASLAPIETVPAQDDEARQHAALRLFLAASERLAGTPAAAYLSGRGINLAELGRQPRALRFHPSCYHAESGIRWPALLAAVSDGDGQHVATHRTWLQVQRDGCVTKAPVRNPKMSLGRVWGGSIRLWRGASGKSLRAAPAGEVPVIAEGIETALSVAMAMPERRVLASVSLGNMGSVWLPPQITEVLLVLDNDHKPAAIAAQQRVINAHVEAGRAVRIARSPVGKDFNDALLLAA